MKQKLPERRRFVRMAIPLKAVLNTGERRDEVLTNNISPMGLRVEVKKELVDAGLLDMALYIASKDKPIRLTGKVIWQKKVSLEDKAPFDVGLEIVDIDDGDKNIFLKCLCDLLYDSSYQART